MKPVRLTLLCHALTDAQRQGRFALDEGIEAVSIALPTLKPSTQVLTAPETRTRQTAALLAVRADVVEALRDGDAGRWQGQSLETLQARESEGLARWLGDADAAPHGGESFTEVRQRVGAWLDDFRAPGAWLAVTHPMVIRAAMLHVLDAPSTAMQAIDVAPLTRLELSFVGRWRLRV